MRVLCFTALLCAATVGSATTLTLSAAVDNVYEAFVSTDDSVLGTQFLSGSNWSATQTGSIALTAGVTNYLHIRARDQGPPAMMIASVSLSDNLFWFPNLGQTLDTNTTDWKVSLTGFGSDYITPTDLGANGTSPWGNRPDIAPSARFLWAGGTDTADRYFSVAITTPEPATFLALGLGIAALRRRRGR